MTRRPRLRLAEHGSMGGDERRAHAGDDGAETPRAPGRVLGRPSAHVRGVRPAHERVGARSRVARRAARRPRRRADAQPARTARGHVRVLQGRLLPRAAQQPVHRRRRRVPRRRLGRGRGRRPTPTGRQSCSTPSSAPVAVVVAGADERPDGTRDHDALVAASDDSSAVVPVDRDALAWLFYTSGTTGRPKGAMLTHGNLSFVTASWLADLTPMTEVDVTLHAAPLSHGAGFHALAATARGARQVIPSSARFEPDAILELLARERVTNTWMVPTQIVMLTDAASDHARRAARSSPRRLRRRAVRAGRPEARARSVRAGVRAALRPGRDPDDGDDPARVGPRRRARRQLSRTAGLRRLRATGHGRAHPR